MENQRAKMEKKILRCPKERKKCDKTNLNVTFNLILTFLLMIKVNVVYKTTK